MKKLYLASLITLLMQAEAMANSQDDFCETQHPGSRSAQLTCITNYAYGNLKNFRDRPSQPPAKSAALTTATALSSRRNLHPEQQAHFVANRLHAELNGLGPNWNGGHATSHDLKRAIRRHHRHVSTKKYDGVTVIQHKRNLAARLAWRAVEGITGQKIEWDDFANGRIPNTNQSQVWHRKMQEGSAKHDTENKTFLRGEGAWGVYARASLVGTFKIEGVVPVGAGFNVVLPLYTCSVGKGCVSIVDRINKERLFTFAVSGWSGLTSDNIIPRFKFDREAEVTVVMDARVDRNAVRVNSVQLASNIDGEYYTTGIETSSSIQGYHDLFQSLGIPGGPEGGFGSPGESAISHIHAETAQNIVGRQAQALRTTRLGFLTEFTSVEASIPVTSVLNPNFVKKFNDPSVPWASGWSGNSTASYFAMGSGAAIQHGYRVALGGPGFSGELRVYASASGSFMYSPTWEGKRAAASQSVLFP